MFDEKYYTTGNYVDYLTRDFGSIADAIIEALRLQETDRIIDYGCAYGGLIQAFYTRGFQNIHGVDISEWAIHYGKSKYPEIADRLELNRGDIFDEGYDYVFFLDVLEHIPETQIKQILSRSSGKISCEMIVKVPISNGDNSSFALDISNNDNTHITCHPREWWLETIANLGYRFNRDLETDVIYSSKGVLAGIFS